MYGTVEAVLSSHFTTRLTPHPDCWYDCFKGLNKKIYVAMQGASEFTLGGELAAWSITTRLKAVNVPTLVVMGEHDTMYDIRLSLSLSLFQRWLCWGKTTQCTWKTIQCTCRANQIDQMLNWRLIEIRGLCASACSIICLLPITLVCSTPAVKSVSHCLMAFYTFMVTHKLITCPYFF